MSDPHVPSHVRGAPNVRHPARFWCKKVRPASEKRPGFLLTFAGMGIVLSILCKPCKCLLGSCLPRRQGREKQAQNVPGAGDSTGGGPSSTTPLLPPTIVEPAGAVAVGPIAAGSINFAPCPDDKTPFGNDLPDVIHSVLEDDDLNLTGNTIIIGDVHGQDEELRELLKICKYDSKQDRIIFVGNFIGHSMGSVQVLLMLEEENVFAVRGDAEDRFLQEYLQWKSKFITDVDDDGVETSRPPGGPGAKKPKVPWCDNVTNADVDILNQLPFSIVIPSMSLMIVHGGLVPGIPLGDQKLLDLLTLQGIEEYTKEEGQKGWRRAEDSSRWSPLWANQYEGPYYVIFGHDDTIAKKRLTFTCAAGLNYSCGIKEDGGWLAALIVPSNMQWDAGKSVEWHAAVRDRRVQGPDYGTQKEAINFAQRTMVGKGDSASFSWGGSGTAGSSSISAGTSSASAVTSSAVPAKPRAKT